MINLRTLEKLEEFAEAVEQDHGIDPAMKVVILSRCVMQAQALAERVAMKDQGSALFLLSQIESRG